MRRQEELALRRRTLQLRCEQLRRDFAAEVVAIEGSVGRARHALGVLRRFAPALAVAGGGALFVLRRRLRPLAWLARGVVAATALRRLVVLARGLQPRSSAPK